MSTSDSSIDPAAKPDTIIDAAKVFGIQTKMQVPAFKKTSEHVPELDDAYRFDRETTLAILAGFAFNRRVMVQGYHGTGKSTHIEQVAARLNWPLRPRQSRQPYQPHRPDRQGRHRPEGRPAGHRIPRRHTALGAAASRGAGVRRI